MMFANENNHTPLSACAAFWGLLVVTAGTTVAGPLDRTSITTYITSHGSSIDPVDMNNDCVVSDVDVALIFRNKLVSQYGEQLSTGDADGDGFVTAGDLQFSIAKILRTSFGKVTGDDQPVGIQDLAEVASGVSAGSPDSDVNVDGQSDISDVVDASLNLGLEILEEDIQKYAWELFEYVGAIQDAGVESVMETECAGDPDGHLVGVSNTWPPRPASSGWPANHLESISRTWWDEDPERHAVNVSRKWPPNHEREVSETWPADHGFLASAGNSQAGHDEQLSRTWPSNHEYEASLAWGGDHEETTSRTWWPNHEVAASNELVFPPGHTGMLSSTWQHGVDVSGGQWPPNHQQSVSQAWGSQHNSGVSASFPPGHVAYASNTWPGPQPWPPSHTFSVSSSWGEPGPGEWPIFPPSHDWWTTFGSTLPPIPAPVWPF